MAAFAAVAGVAADTVSVLTAVLSLPAFGLAILAVLFATVCRKPRDTGAPPEASQCVAYIEAAYAHDPSAVTAELKDGRIGEVEASTLGIWNEACVRHRVLMGVKADWLSRATTMKTAAVAALVIPLVGVTIEKCCSKSTGPKVVEVRSAPSDH